MHCISCSTFYRCSHRLFFQSMRKFPPTDVRFTQNRVFHLHKNLFLLSGGRPLETLGLCGKRLECAGKGASQVWCSVTVPGDRDVCVDWYICAGYYVIIRWYASGIICLLRPGFERGISEVSGVTERSELFQPFQNSTEVPIGSMSIFIKTFDR